MKAISVTGLIKVTVTGIDYARRDPTAGIVDSRHDRGLRELRREHNNSGIYLVK